MDVLMLSRIQFGLNISFHILFPAISIALSWVVVFFCWRYQRTQSALWHDAYYFWVKVFALTFALGVVTGITMSLQFSTNWPLFMERAGNIAGPMLGYEVLTAFFLEAGFLGVMLYGARRVPPWVHLLASLVVAVGTLLSAFWILSLNSWMQTPQGFRMDAAGVLHPEDWFAIIFNPSFPYRFIHMILASTLTVAFLLAGLSAWQVLKNRHHRATGVVMRTGLSIAALAIVLQILAGDAHGLNTLKHQPAKLAAIEAIWQTEQPAALTLFALPNSQNQRNDYSIAIPKLGSLILTHSLDGEIKGLNTFAEHPPVAAVFFGFRIMVAVGMLMLLISWYALWRLYQADWQPDKLSRPLLRVLAGCTFLGWVGVLAGWYVTEIGRQPFLVYGILPTADGIMPHIGSTEVALSLAGYAIINTLLLAAYVTVLKFLAEQKTTDANNAGVH